MVYLLKLRGKLLYDDFLKAQEVQRAAETAGYAPAMVWALLYQAGKDDGGAHQKARAKKAYDALNDLRKSIEKSEPPHKGESAE